MKRVWGGTWFGVTGVAYSAATGLGNNGGGRRVNMVVWGGGVKTNTEGLKTTKKWEADVHAKR